MSPSRSRHAPAVRVQAEGALVEGRAGRGARHVRAAAVVRSAVKHSEDRHFSHVCVGGRGERARGGRLECRDDVASVGQLSTLRRALRAHVGVRGRHRRRRRHIGMGQQPRAAPVWARDSAFCPCAACKLSQPPRADPLPAGALSLQEWWVEECACCLCGCLSTGPVFIIIGLLFLVRPHAPPCCSCSTRARTLCCSLGAAGSSGSSSAPQWRRTPRLKAAAHGAQT